MPRRYRQDSVQLNLRLRQAERDRIYAVIPRGSFNAVAVRLIMDYVHVAETNAPRPIPPVEDPAA